MNFLFLLLFIILHVNIQFECFCIHYNCRCNFREPRELTMKLQKVTICRQNHGHIPTGDHGIICFIINCVKFFIMVKSLEKVSVLI